MQDACARSPVFWINAFVWTYRQKRVLPSGDEAIVQGALTHTPLVTWAVQDEFVADVVASIDGGTDLNIKKSRDMGASWLALMTYLHCFLYRHDVNFLLLSRKEELVDEPGDMDSLFEKLRYALHWLPVWMKPRIKSRYMFLSNQESGNTITGESTNADAGRAGRKTSVMVDEAASIRNAEEIEAALSQVSPSVLWISTSKGPGTWFHQRIASNKGKTTFMHWIRHPEKARGGHEVADPQTGKVRWTSPWYENICGKLSRKTVAQEIDGDDGAAGDLFFDPHELWRHRADHAHPEMARGDLIADVQFTPEGLRALIHQKKHSALHWAERPGQGCWRLWTPLIDGRPAQHYTYVLALDISNGAGESNSVASLLALETGEIIGKWWSAHASPEETAEMAARAGIWLGGHGGCAFIIWENNGPGGIFGRKLVKLGYPRFYRQRLDDNLRNQQTPRWGWHSNPERKEVALGLYRDALASDRIINHCTEALDEAGDYIYDDNGALVPGRLRSETAGGRKLHGDHVIADALCVVAASELPKQSEASSRPPQGSFLARKRQFMKSIDSNLAWGR